MGSGPTNGFLQIDRDSAVTISFEFADGVVLTNSVPVNWNLGTVQFAEDLFLSSDTIIIRVFDLDMNLNPEAIDSIPLHVFSDSNVAGITVDALETNESSSSFVATVSLSHTLPSSGNRLYSLPGDEIFAKYDDHTLPKPYSISDNLEIETSAKIDSSVRPIERLQTSPVVFSDSFGSPIQSFSSNSQLQIVGTVTNDQVFTQKFVYLFQVKDDSNSVESISWIQGELSSNQSLDVSQSWTPKKSGTYHIETFVWDSLNIPVAVSPSVSTQIAVK
ncbi:MAG: hypothetical protein ACR2LL_09165 [Nitrosopumilus sp.]